MLGTEASTALIGEQENGPRQIRFQRVRLVVASQNAVFPDQQIGIVSCELVPIRRRLPRHTLADQKEVRMRNRLRLLHHYLLRLIFMSSKIINIIGIVYILAIRYPLANSFSATVIRESYLVINSFLPLEDKAVLLGMRFG